MPSSLTSKTSIPKTSASSRRKHATAALAVALFLCPAPALAQAVSLVGSVVRHGEDGSQPLTGEWVVLHRVTLGGGAPIDSARTDAAGRFRLRGAVDSATVLLVSARHMGVAYFGPPIHGFRATLDSLAPIVVYDTTFGRPVIAVRQRHLVLRETPERTVQVLDIIELGNEGTTTRVADSTGPPTWTGLIGFEAASFEVGDGDFSPEAVERQGDSVRVYGPIPPGTRQLSISYTVPRQLGRFELRLDQAVRSLALLVEGEAAVTVEPLESVGPRNAEGRVFQTFLGRDLAGGALVRVRAGGGRSPFDWALAALVVSMIAALAFGAMRLRARPRAAAPSEALAETLAAEIAALDTRYAGGEPSVAHAEWQRYQAQRNALKERLKTALARDQGRQ